MIFFEWIFRILFWIEFWIESFLGPIQSKKWIFKTDRQIPNIPIEETIDNTILQNWTMPNTACQ